MSITPGAGNITDADRANLCPQASEPCTTRISGEASSTAALASATAPIRTQMCVLPLVALRISRAQMARSEELAGANEPDYLLLVVA